MDTHKTTWEEREENLPFDSYIEFLNSDYWKGVKKKANKKLLYKRCEFCGSMNNIELHHKHYRFIGEKHELSAIIAVCRDHHQFIHNYAKEKDVSVEVATDKCYNMFEKWRFVPKSLEVYDETIIKRNGTKQVFDQYIVRSKSGNSKAHIWTGEDTKCEMWSTGGIRNKDEYEVVDDTAKQICKICLNK